MGRLTEKYVTLRVADLRRPHFAYVRKQKQSDEVVESYKAAFDDLPPPVVWYTGERWVLLDGFTRLEAARQLGLKEIRCRIYDGDAKEAEMYSLQINATHGGRLTAEDTMQAIKRVLALDHGLSEREIGRRFGVSNTQVGRLRREVQVEEAYRAHLDAQGLSPSERGNRLARAKRLKQETKLAIQRQPPELWARLIENTPTDGSGRIEVKRLARVAWTVEPKVQSGTGADGPTLSPESAGMSAPVQPDAGAPVQPDAGVEAVVRAAEGMIQRDHGRIARRRIDAFRDRLAQVEDAVAQLEDLLPAMGEGQAAADAERAARIADRMRRIAMVLGAQE
jgi:hypothetical protein